MNNVKYEIYDTINENIQINKLSELLLQLHDICSDNLEIVNNSSWKANAKVKYNQHISSIDQIINKLDIDLEKLKSTVILIDEIKGVNLQIKNLEDQQKISTNNPVIETQLEELYELKRRKETDIVSRWNV